jgi:hypothetical protein
MDLAGTKANENAIQEYVLTLPRGVLPARLLLRRLQKTAEDCQEGCCQEGSCQEGCPD